MYNSFTGAQWQIYNSLLSLQKVVEKFNDDLVNKLWSPWDQLDRAEEKTDESVHARVTVKLFVVSSGLRVLCFPAQKLNSALALQVFTKTLLQRGKIKQSVWKEINFRFVFQISIITKAWFSLKNANCHARPTNSCSFTFWQRIRWEDRWYSHVCTVNMKPQLAALVSSLYAKPR